MGADQGKRACDVTNPYMLITYGEGSLLVVKLPGLELLDGFIDCDFSHFHSLLQGYELSLPGCFHPSVVVVHGGERLDPILSWTGGERRFSSEGAVTTLSTATKHSGR